MRVLRNVSAQRIDTNFNGRNIVIKPRCVHTTENDKEANYLLETYGFLRDETKAITYEPQVPRRAFGKKMRRY